MILDGETNQPLSGVIAESSKGEILTISTNGLILLSNNFPGDSLIISYPSVPRQYFILKSNRKVDTLLLYSTIELPAVDVVEKRQRPKKLLKKLLKLNRKLICNDSDTLLYLFKHVNHIVDLDVKEIASGVLKHPFDNYARALNSMYFDVCNLIINVDSSFINMAEDYLLMNRMKYVVNKDVLRSGLGQIINYQDGVYKLNSDSISLTFIITATNGNYVKYTFGRDSILQSYELFGASWGEIRGPIQYDYSYYRWDYLRGDCIYPSKIKYFESYHTKGIDTPIIMMAELSVTSDQLDCSKCVKLMMTKHLYELELQSRMN